jgi:predicted transposase YdaD
MFKCTSGEELKELTMSFPIISRAAESLREISLRERYNIWRLERDMARYDRESELYCARREGKEEGKAEGLAEGLEKGLAEGEAKLTARQREIARNALKEGASVEFAAKITGLDLATVKSLQ